jgi:molybdate transport system permease protein
VTRSATPAPRPAGAAGASFRALALLAVAGRALFLVLPFAGLFARVSLPSLVARLGEPQVLSALRLSLLTSLSATGLVVLFGTPAAYLLATRRFPGKPLVEVLIDLPMVLPPTVAGLALLMAFGRAGLAGDALTLAGITLPFTTLGVIVAQCFMAAPFYIAPARAGFASVDRRLLEVAATLRAAEPFTFFRVVLPLAAPSLLAGVAMSGARALGEFGATITFAGNLPGTTQTMPLAVYVALQSDLDTAVVLSMLLLAMSIGLLLGLRAAPVGLFGSRPGAGTPDPQAAR